MDWDALNHKKLGHHRGLIQWSQGDSTPPRTPCRGDVGAIKRHHQMLLSLADAQRLNEAGSIAALLGAFAIFLVTKIRYWLGAPVMLHCSPTC